MPVVDMKHIRKPGIFATRAELHLPHRRQDSLPKETESRDIPFPVCVKMSALAKERPTGQEIDRHSVKFGVTDIDIRQAGALGKLEIEQRRNVISGPVDKTVHRHQYPRIDTL